MLKLLSKSKTPLALLATIKDVVIESDLKTGLKALSFSFPVTSEYAPLIQSECYIQTAEDEFVIKEVNKENNDWFSVHAKSNIEELTGKPWLNFASLESTIENTIQLAIAGSGWTVSMEQPVVKKRTIRKEFGSTYDIINDCQKVFMVDIGFDTLQRKVLVWEKRGADKGAYFTNQLNLKKLSEQASSYDFITRLIPIGKDDLRITSVNGGKEYVDNFQYSNKVVAQYWIDKRYTDVQSLKDDAVAKLAELSAPKVSYSCDILALGNSVGLGDTITLIDNIKEIRQKQRVVKIKQYPLTPEKDSIEIANRTLSFSEQQAELDAAAQIVGDITTDSGAIDGNKIEGLPEVDMTIPDGSITADKIAANAITTDKLAANSITANKIQAGAIDATHIKAGTITANSAIIDDAAIGTAKIADAAITNAKIADASIDSAKIDVGQINSAHIQDAAIGTAQIADAAITVAKIQDAFIDNLVANQGKFNSAQIGELEAKNIKAGAITTDKLAAGSVVADKIAAGAISTDKLAANSITSDKIAAGTIVAGDIAANAITTEKINAGAVTAGKVAANAITAGNIQAGAITAGKLAANSVEAGNIKAGAITADKIGANAITTDKLAANSVTADKIKAGSIDAGKITADAINTIQLGASDITANKIASGEIKVGNANILDGTINGAKIASATITNAQIADATIESAKIKDLNASKINTGTLDATKVTINSTSGRLSIANNTLTIKDAQTTPKTRVQVGLDARGKYGILVMNAAGEAIFDSDYGVLSDKGLNDGVVSTDKIVDEAVAPSKIQIRELWAEEAYINEFNGQTINADNITTGTISGERIDIKGLINFEALDSDLSKLFVPGSGNGTIINGGFIGADTIKAGSIDLYSGITVRKEDGTPSFAIAENGEVEINGLLKSGNYTPGNLGYKIAPDGTAEFNQAVVRGSIDLPNAGITNYGATIGNDNLLTKSEVEKTISTYYTLYPISTDVVKTLSKKTVTISFDAKKLEGCPTVNMYPYFRGEAPIAPNFPKIGDITNEYKRYSSTATMDDLTNTDAINVAIHSGVGNSGILVRNVKVEIGSEATPWCPNKDEQFNYTRIWAGSSYEGRDTAPFRVSQDGTLYALDGTFEGKLYGDYNNDYIHIHKDKIEINDKIVPLGEDMSTYTTTTPFVSLGTGASVINTNLSIGNNNIEYLLNSNAFNIKNTDFKVESSIGTVLINKDGGAFGGLNILGPSGGHHILRGSTSADKQGTLVFDSEGNQGATGDFSFTRKNYQESCKVDIDGALTVKDTINSTKQNIEMRSVADEGWGFYAT